MKIALGLLIAFSVGFSCRWFGVPVPSPNSIIGALLVVSMTAGFLAANYFLSK